MVFEVFSSFIFYKPLFFFGFPQCFGMYAILKSPSSLFLSLPVSSKGAYFLSLHWWKEETACVFFPLPSHCFFFFMLGFKIQDVAHIFYLIIFSFWKIIFDIAVRFGHQTKTAVTYPDEWPALGLTDPVVFTLPSNEGVFFIPRSIFSFKSFHAWVFSESWKISPFALRIPGICSWLVLALPLKTLQETVLPFVDTFIFICLIACISTLLYPYILNIYLRAS